jgi:tyrosyl-tRNA synthetase
MMLTIDAQLSYLTKGCVDVVRAGELKTKLERAATTGVPLTVKVGFDPTAPDLHLGHTVLLRKMKHFQDLGHRVVFLIGDFTGLIGDPTGRSKTRPPLTREDIAANAETYKTQVFKILDPALTVVDFNERWLGALGAEGLVRLAARYNVAQMLERRDFRTRFQAGKPIAIHEFLYPLAQAYDSVFLKADVELGGTDQLFNLNVGRDLMPGYGLEAQVVMTTPLLEGLDGVEKMSKSLGNYVGVTELPADMFGKMMSISDELMWRYYLLLTDDAEADVNARRARVASGAEHPKAAKVALARRVVEDFHGAAAAQQAAVAFDARFTRNEINAADLEAFEVPQGTRWTHVLVRTANAASNSEAARKIQEGAVRLGDVRVTDPRGVFEATGAHVLRVGRRACTLVGLPAETPS